MLATGFAGYNLPKSHCDLVCLLIEISIQLSHG
jgi:hypothetical protein